MPTVVEVTRWCGVLFSLLFVIVGNFMYIREVSSVGIYIEHPCEVPGE